ncbi:Dabb family protein [Clostridium senegalense]|uniref:Dabb family protein n=1 Tax=Clostridium senegalense TaxID=1465809 RepID=UPI000289295E|nr:Dabb family protein [Clostridium senegalense]MBU5226421.1 Dabb family protein [Clostridium senegalense]
MFTHIVFFKLKNPSDENLKKAKEIFLSMNGKIDCLKYLEVGVDELHTERSYDVALVTKFNSLEDMNIYQSHPYHVNHVLAPLKEMIESSKAIDYHN